MKETILSNDEVRKELSKSTKFKNPKFFMGTNAYHLIANISRDIPDLFVAFSRTRKYYIGNWIYGFGFQSVLFPRETSRKLTFTEIKKYNNSYIKIGGYVTKLHVN